MTATEAVTMYDRIRSSGFPPVTFPWERMGVTIGSIDGDLLAWRHNHGGGIDAIAICVGYTWDMTREYLPLAEIADMLVRKTQGEAGATMGADVKIAEEDRKKYPTITDHLTQDKWDDGTTRELSKLNVWWDTGVYKIMLRDVAQGQILFVSCPVLAKLLPTLEAVLTSPTADWRPDRAAQYQAKRKK